MAHIEIWYRCPCGKSYSNQKEAIECAVSHVRSERWAVGSSGKGVRIYDNHAPNSVHGIIGALREAELDDFTEQKTKRDHSRRKNRSSYQKETHKKSRS